MSTSKGESLDMLSALEELVVRNDDLLELESLIGRFNIFDALRIADREISHSQFLAFLLDPLESHGHAHLFLRYFLIDLLSRAPADARPFSPIEIDSCELRSVMIKREWENIDLLITCQEPKFLVAIENKVKSGEHSNQLARYRERVEKHFPGLPALFVFLTVDGASASEADWLPYTYREIFKTFNRVRKIHAKSIGNDVALFLDHYLGLIGNRFMENDKIQELCERIYKNHRQALRLIWDRIGSPSSKLVSEIETALTADARWHMFYSASTYVTFVPKEWLAWMPALGLDRKDTPQCWFVLRIEVYEEHKRIDFFAQVQKMEDLTLRRSLIELLLKHGPSHGLERKRSPKVTESYTRVASRTKVVEWDSDDPPSPSEIHDRILAKLSSLYPKIMPLGPILRDALHEEHGGDTP